MNETNKVLPPLPSSDNEFWDGEKYISKTDKHELFSVCPIHTSQDWMNGTYIDNKDGTVSCKYCGWGTSIPGYMRVLNGKIIDLRSPSRG